MTRTSDSTQDQSLAATPKLFYSFSSSVSFITHKDQRLDTTSVTRNSIYCFLWQLSTIVEADNFAAVLILFIGIFFEQHCWLSSTRNGKNLLPHQQLVFQVLGVSECTQRPRVVGLYVCARVCRLEEAAKRRWSAVFE